MTKRSKDGDAENTGFGFPENVVAHKPGFEPGSQEREPEAAGNNRFRPADQREIPKETLAARIAKSAEGR